MISILKTAQEHTQKNSMRKYDSQLHLWISKWNKQPSSYCIFFLICHPYPLETEEVFLNEMAMDLRNFRFILLNLHLWEGMINRPDVLVYIWPVKHTKKKKEIFIFHLLFWNPQTSSSGHVSITIKYTFWPSIALNHVNPARNYQKVVELLFTRWS